MVHSTMRPSAALAGDLRRRDLRRRDLRGNDLRGNDLRGLAAWLVSLIFLWIRDGSGERSANPEPLARLRSCAPRPNMKGGPQSAAVSLILSPLTLPATLERGGAGDRPGTASRASPVRCAPHVAAHPAAMPSAARQQRFFVTAMGRRRRPHVDNDRPRGSRPARRLRSDDGSWSAVWADATARGLRSEAVRPLDRAFGRRPSLGRPIIRRGGRSRMVAGEAALGAI